MIFLRYLLLTLLLIGAISSISLKAQDPIFSQFYAAPLQINPGFTGSAFAPRFGVSYRNQWPGFNNAYRTYSLWYEQSVPRLNSGFGFNFEGDNAGQGIWRVNRFGVNYAYKLPISDKTDIKIGVETGFHQTNLNWDKLIFPDQLDPLEGNIHTSADLRPDITTKTLFDVSSGLLLVNPNFWVGFSLKHLNTPNEAVLGINDNLYAGLPLRYALHGGTEIVLNKGDRFSPPIFISPNFLFLSQGPYQQLNIGAYAGIGSIFGGLWFRHTFSNADAAILSMGFREGIFKIGLSYDMTVSKLAGKSGGTYEISMSVLLDKDEVLQKKQKRAQINDCLNMFR